MPALHITGTGTGERKRMWFQCQIHAREWISGAVCQYLVEYLVSNYRVVQSVTDLLDTVYVRGGISMPRPPTRRTCRRLATTTACIILISL